jgi:hypothetical protein
MGEKSKFIGEIGEKVFDAMASILGWHGTSGKQIKCIRRSKHNKTTHGIDYLVISNNPLIADETEVAIVSIKNVRSGSEKSKLKSYIEDVVTTSECFQIGSEFPEYLEGFNNRNVVVKEIVFWIQNDQDPDYNLVDKSLVAPPSNKMKYQSVTCVDNKRISYFYEFNKFAKTLFTNYASFEYYYPDTGLNESIRSLRLSHGNYTPINWLTSPIIPYKVTLRDGNTILILGVNEPFDKDCFRRMAGLAQSLTGGWCNSIILCFPDFRFSDHKEITEKVMMQFEDKDFVKMVTVRSYIDSFFSLEDKPRSYFKARNESEQKSSFNIERMLPYGDTLRQLLNQTYINKSDIVTLLRYRGVLVPKGSSKSELIPMLSTSFISPSEFEYLRNCQSSRANSERISSAIIITSDSDSITDELIQTKIDIASIIEKVAPSVEIVGRPTFSTGEDGSLKLRIPTKNTHVNKDWASSNTSNYTEVRISSGSNHGKNTKNRVAVSASSTENKKIGQEIIKAIEIEVKKNGNLREDFTMEKTLAAEFSHTKRAALLFKLFQECHLVNNKITFKDLSNVDFIISENYDKALKDDLLGLKEYVDRSIFSGTQLQDIKYIADKRYFESVIFTELIVLFNFDYNDLHGDFEVQYGFTDFDPTKKTDKTEFEFKITRITPFITRTLTKRESHDLRSWLTDEFLKIKQYAIDETGKKYARQGKLFV